MDDAVAVFTRLQATMMRDGAELYAPHQRESHAFDAPGGTGRVKAKMAVQSGVRAQSPDCAYWPVRDACACHNGNQCPRTVRGRTRMATEYVAAKLSGVKLRLMRSLYLSI